MAHGYWGFQNWDDDDPHPGEGVEAPGDAAGTLKADVSKKGEDAAIDGDTFAAASATSRDMYARDQGDAVKKKPSQWRRSDDGSSDDGSSDDDSVDAVETMEHARAARAARDLRDEILGARPCGLPLDETRPPR